jgi:large subunit ribosomal protein L4
MVEAKVYSFQEGAEPRAAALDERLFGAEVNEDLLYRMVRVQMADRRQGTASTKSRGGRREPAARGTGPADRLCGSAAARRSARSPARTR